MLLNLIDVEELVPPDRDARINVWNINAQPGTAHLIVQGRVSVVLFDIGFEILQWTQVEPTEEEKALFNMHEEFDECLLDWEVETVFIGTLNLFAFTIEITTEDDG